MFSIVMPLFNRADTVRRTIDCVLDQEITDFELTVVDDGSTDASAVIVAGIGAPQITVIRQANAGPGDPRTRGIEAARGDWIAFLDSDDPWFPDHEDRRRRNDLPPAAALSRGTVVGAPAPAADCRPTDICRAAGLSLWAEALAPPAPFACPHLIVSQIKRQADCRGEKRLGERSA